jgi:hypothetical protein
VEAGVLEVAFRCPVVTCKRNESPFRRLDNMRRHVRRQHRGDAEGLERAIVQQGDEFDDSSGERDEDIAV